MSLLKSLPLCLENLVLEYTESMMVGAEMNKFDTCLTHIKYNISYKIKPIMSDADDEMSLTWHRGVRTTNTLCHKTYTLVQKTVEYELTLRSYDNNKYEEILMVGDEEFNIGTLHNGKRVLDII